MAGSLEKTSRFVRWCVGVAGVVCGLVAVFWIARARTGGPDAYALADAYAASSPEVRARVGAIVATALAPGELRCLSESVFPPTGDATFTWLVTGARDHVKLDVRAARDAQGWHLVDAKLRSTDDAPRTVSSGCSSGPAWGPAGNYGKH